MNEINYTVWSLRESGGGPLVPSSRADSWDASAGSGAYFEHAVMQAQEAPSKGRSAWGGIRQAAGSLARFLPRNRDPGPEPTLRHAVPVAYSHSAYSASACAEPQAARERVEDAEKAETCFGFATGLEDVYELGPELGRGGNAVVRVARDRRSGREFACKSLKKVAFLVSPQTFCFTQCCALVIKKNVLWRPAFCATVQGMQQAAERAECLLVSMRFSRSAHILTPAPVPDTR